ncbi:MAG: mannonate dehydratase [Oscillospiraceae bacterium]|nr:mannonate dehydratase [Oscillospiraceae bacterium]
MLRIAEALGCEITPMWYLARQLGVKEAVAGLPYNRPGFDYTDFNDFMFVYNKFKDFGFRVTVLEGAPENHNIKLGLPGRDEEIDKFIKLLGNMARLGVEAICYNFMPVFGWFRTSMAIETRGGAFVTGYDHEVLKDAPLTEFGEVSQDDMWANYEYFIRAVAPEAQRLGVKLALHPDDPPISPLRGISRILISAAAFERAMSISPNPYHGMTYCQGCFSTMGEDVPETIAKFGKQNKIFFIHFRDVVGSAAKFRETFHDEGKTDMPGAIKAYLDAGVNCPVRVDHVPTMHGENNDRPGYESMGRLYAIGYLRGLLDSHTISST